MFKVTGQKTIPHPAARPHKVISWNGCQRPQAKAACDNLWFVSSQSPLHPRPPPPPPSHPAPCKFIQDNLWVPDSGYWIQDSLFVELGIGIPITLTGFRIHWAELQIPKPRITGRLSVEWTEAIEIFNEPRFLHKMLMIAVYIFPHLLIRNISIVPFFGCEIPGTFAVSEYLFIRTWFLWLVEIWKPSYTSWIPVILVTPVF